MPPRTRERLDIAVRRVEVGPKVLSVQPVRPTPPQVVGEHLPPETCRVPGARPQRPNLLLEEPPQYAPHHLISSGRVDVGHRTTQVGDAARCRSRGPSLPRKK